MCYAHVAHELQTEAVAHTTLFFLLAQVEHIGQELSCRDEGCCTDCTVYTYRVFAQFEQNVCWRGGVAETEVVAHVPL